MVVFSAFDGYGGGRVALDRIGLVVDTYYASEVNVEASLIQKRNYPTTIRVGDVTKVDPSKFGHIDLLIGGSPCQGFSKAGDGRGFADERSKLFFEYVRLLKGLKPTYFLLENVEMSPQDVDIISKLVGVRPRLINSALFSAQERFRLYWTNIPYYELPKKSTLVLKDILEPLRDVKREFLLSDSAIEYMEGDYCGIERFEKNWQPITGKSKTLTTKFGSVPLGVIKQNSVWRFLTPLECERLQTLPDNYTAGVHKTARYHMLGNGWTVNVIAYLLLYLREEYEWQ